MDRRPPQVHSFVQAGALQSRKPIGDCYRARTTSLDNPRMQSVMYIPSTLLHYLQVASMYVPACHPEHK